MGQTVTSFHTKPIAKEDAKLVWIDFILEVFRVAGVSNYEKLVEEFLPEPVLREREHIAEENRTTMNSQFTKLAIGIALFILFAYVYANFLT